VVDDDPYILRLYARILSKGGHAVHTEQSSTKVVGTLDQEGPFDVLVLDLCMPEPDGFEVLKDVRSRFPGLRVLVTSGFLGGGLLPASELLGAGATLTKADAPGLLLSKVDNLLA